jgi:hypothetical protein
MTVRLFWIASSLPLLAMTEGGRGNVSVRQTSGANQTTRRENEILLHPPPR